jgi:hypothetical protein
MPTPEQRNAELRRILWALQDEKKAVDALLKHGRENQIEPIRYASLTMLNDGLTNAIAFARQAVEQPEQVPR